MTINTLPQADALSGWHAPVASAELACDSAWPESAHHPAEQASSQQLPGPHHTCPFPLWHLQQKAVVAGQEMPLLGHGCAPILQDSSQFMAYCYSSQELHDQMFGESGRRKVKLQCDTVRHVETRHESLTKKAHDRAALFQYLILLLPKLCAAER